MLFLSIYLLGSVISSILIIVINKSTKSVTTLGDLLRAIILSWFFVLCGVSIFIGCTLESLDKIEIFKNKK